jgi:hypothetical protein
MSEQQEAIFPEGIYLGRVPDAAPSFIITNQSIHVDRLISWLTANKNLADEKGYIRLQGKESKGVDEKTGQLRRYFQVDTWKPKDATPTEVPF